MFYKRLRERNTKTLGASIIMSAKYSSPDKLSFLKI